MEFRLTYQGPLPASGSRNRRVEEKHVIRRALHPQLKLLWEQPPLSEQREELLREPEPGDQNYALISRVDDFTFVSTISSQMSLLAELEITFLRSGPAGEFVTGGDIDNRLKTLLDALRCPMSRDEIPSTYQPAEGESPLYCLLDDDKIVSKLTISADRLLKQVSRNDVELLIFVKSRAWRRTWGNVLFG